MVAPAERGQLLLAGAFVLAVALIGLTLVLSASSYSTALASQDNPVVSGGDAVTTRESVRRELGDLLASANRGAAPGASNPGIDDERTINFRENLTVYANAMRDYHSRRGRLVNATQAPIANDDRTTAGARLVQHDSTTFDQPNNRSSDDTDGWNVTKGARIRNATFVFDSVPKYSEPNFTVLFSSSNDFNWRVHVYQGIGGADWKTTVENESSGFTEACTRPGNSAPMRVDMGSATVDGDSCYALEKLSPAPPYRVRFENGTNAEGRYWLTVDREPSNLPDYRASDDSKTEKHEVLYGATARYRYHTATVDYETNLTVAPGEIP